MRYVRFMSGTELEKYKSGQTLKNVTDWRKKRTSYEFYRILLF